MSYGLPRDGKAPNSPQFTDESTGEPVYSLGDRFFVPHDARLQLAQTDGEKSKKIKLSTGDIMRIAQIDQLSVSQPIRSIRKMIVDLFRHGEPFTAYASCEITPKEMRHFKRERRAALQLNPITIRPDRVDELINPMGSFPCRKTDSPQEVRSLILGAVRDKLEKDGLDFFVSKA